MLELTPGGLPFWDVDHALYLLFYLFLDLLFENLFPLEFGLLFVWKIFYHLGSNFGDCPLGALVLEIGVNHVVLDEIFNLFEIIQSIH